MQQIIPEIYYSMYSRKWTIYKGTGVIGNAHLSHFNLHKMVICGSLALFYTTGVLGFQRQTKQQQKLGNLNEQNSDLMRSELNE